jgi:hypothetical protein
MGIIVKGNGMGGDNGSSMNGGGMDGGGMDGSGEEGDGVSYEGSIRRSFVSSSPSLSSSASHHRFLVRFAGGDMGDGDLAEAWTLAVDVLTGVL